MAVTYNLGNITGPPGDSGKSPQISGESGNWEVWDWETNSYKDTGIKARGPTGDITGQSLFEYAVEQGFTGTYDEWLREYLARQTDLPWCSGYFQNRSLSASVLNVMTPIAESGDLEMISGDRFIAKQNGVYSITIGAGAVTASAPRLSVWISKYNTIDIMDLQYTGEATTAQWVQTTTYLGYLYTDEYLTISVAPSNAQSGFIATQLLKYSFVQIS